MRLLLSRYEKSEERQVWRKFPWVCDMCAGKLNADSMEMCAQIMAKGRIKTVKLSEHITTGRAQWLRWHGTFTQALPSLIKVPVTLYVVLMTYVQHIDDTLVKPYPLLEGHLSRTA
jgi:hypothetical protein